jgi:hypothetical protein
MGMVLMSKRELNRIDILARLESGHLTPAAAAEPKSRKFPNGTPEKELERPLKAGRQDLPEATDAGHGIPKRTLARPLSTTAGPLLLRSGSTDLTNARGSR